ncbi:MAG: transcriptional regulator [Ilumatobacteraceae bacterium]|nr:transcriptional regulator [Ilumatobacteraceae bacterium]
MTPIRRNAPGPGRLRDRAREEAGTRRVRGARALMKVEMGDLRETAKFAAANAPVSRCVGTMALTPSTLTWRMGPVTRRIVIVAYPGVQALDVTGPHEVFVIASRLVTAEGTNGQPPAYSVEIVSPDGTLIETESGLTIGTRPLPGDVADIDTLIVPGGTGSRHARHDQALIAWITATAAQSRRVVSVCSGTFLIAEAGLADGRTVTTHWARAQRLADDYPNVTVDPDPIYVHDGRLWSSAGVTAGIDLSLALVEEDLGTEVAQMAARWLVMFLRRPGGQTQFAAPVWMPRAERSAIRVVQAHIDDHPGLDHAVHALATRAAMSPRHFTRVFSAQVGEAPGQYVERVRTEAARRALEDTTDTVAVVARRCGFGSAETLRRTFVKRLGIPPDQYRRRFGAA